MHTKTPECAFEHAVSSLSWSSLLHWTATIPQNGDEAPTSALSSRVPIRGSPMEEKKEAKKEGLFSAFLMTRIEPMLLFSDCTVSQRSSLPLRFPQTELVRPCFLLGVCSHGSAFIGHSANASAFVGTAISHKIPALFSRPPVDTVKQSSLSMFSPPPPDLHAGVHKRNNLWIAPLCSSTNANEPQHHLGTSLIQNVYS